MWNEVLEDLIVVKRSGQRVDFNASKIAIAIKKSYESVYENVNEKDVYKVFEKVLTYINDNYKERKTISVEDIQDIIENILQKENEEVYNSFKEYRQKRAASRKVFTEKQQHKFVKAIEKVQEENNLQKYITPYNVLNKFGRIISGEYTKSYVLDNKYVRAYEEGLIYIHDLDHFILGSIPHLNMKLSIKEDDYYLDNFLNELINVQNEVNYEIGINDLDNILEPFFIKKHNYILRNNLYKYFNLYGYLDLLSFKKYEDTINKITDISKTQDILKDFMINIPLRNIINAAINDTKIELNNNIKRIVERIFNTLTNNKKRNTIFNISLGKYNSYLNIIIREEIINYLSDNNYLENVHIIFKITNNNELEYLNRIVSLIINHKNISLEFLNETNTSNDETAEYFSNGIRVFESNDEHNKFATGKMIVGCTSINLARLGLKYSNKDLKDFYQELDEILDLAKNELILTFETIGNKTKENYQTLFTGNVYSDEKLEPNQKIRKVIKSGNLNIGIIGLKECIESLEPTEDKQYDLIIKILKYLNDKMKLYSEETKLNFAIYEPSNISCRKELIAIDKSIYGFNKKISNLQSYTLIEDLKSIKDDYHKLSNIQKEFKGGQLITVSLPSNASNKKVLDLIKTLQAADISYAKIEVGKK